MKNQSQLLKIKFHYFCFVFMFLLIGNRSNAGIIFDDYLVDIYNFKMEESTLSDITDDVGSPFVCTLLLLNSDDYFYWLGGGTDRAYIEREILNRKFPNTEFAECRLEINNRIDIAREKRRQRRILKDQERQNEIAEEIAKKSK